MTYTDNSKVYSVLIDGYYKNTTIFQRYMIDCGLRNGNDIIILMSNQGKATGDLTVWLYPFNLSKVIDRIHRLTEVGTINNSYLENLRNLVMDRYNDRCKFSLYNLYHNYKYLGTYKDYNFINIDIAMNMDLYPSDRKDLIVNRLEDIKKSLHDL